MPRPRPPISSVAVFALLSLLAVAVAWSFWGYSYDDAFITYRYARHWAATGHLEYNPGAAVLGTSAPGYALLLGLLSKLTWLSVPDWGTLLAVLSTLTAALVTRLALGESPPVIRDGVPLLFGAGALLLRWNVEMFGAEQLPILALGAAAAYLALRSGRPVAAGLVASAAMICRLDAALLAGVLGLALWIRERRFPLKFAVAGLLPIALFLLYMYGAFGSIIPNTMAAKQSELGAARVSYTLEEWAWLRRELPLASCLILLVLAGWGAVEGVLASRRRGLPAMALGWVAAFWIIAHEIAYRLLRVPFAPWYQIYLINGLLLLAACGAARLAARAPRPVQLPLAAVLLLPVLVPSALFVRDFWRRPPDPRWDGYVAAGRFIREHRGRSVAAVEIGFLGWESEAPVLDLMGLVRPDALAARKRGDLPALVAHEQPEYLVDATLFRDPWLNPILAHPAIAAGYREVASFPDGRDPGLRVRLLRRVGPGGV
ncbi:MAG TPA: hypothetical protein VIA62_17865 [Thermoanaerobaculia bacterium]|jgi:hypothetical protein|nr:hypothetical protein [Thermoanaerobaculia bacterium]